MSAEWSGLDAELDDLAEYVRDAKGDYNRIGARIYSRLQAYPGAGTRYTASMLIARALAEVELDLMTQ